MGDDLDGVLKFAQTFDHSNLMTNTAFTTSRLRPGLIGIGVVALLSRGHPQVPPNVGAWDKESYTLFIAQRKPIERAQVFQLRNDGNYWFLEMNLFETDDPVRGDSVTYDFFRTHMVALHTNEPAQGPTYRSTRTLYWGQPLWVGVGGVGHGSHRDDHALMATLKWGYGKQILEYVIMARGLHNASGEPLSKAMMRGAYCTGSQAVPPTDSASVGMVQLIRFPDGSAELSIGHDGYDPTTESWARLSAGPRGEPGVPVLELGTASEWVASEDGLRLGTFRFDRFPEGLDLLLILGLLSVEIGNENYPNGEIRGWLQPLRSLYFVGALR
jgi:hypothetical protein